MLKRIRLLVVWLLASLAVAQAANAATFDMKLLSFTDPMALVPMPDNTLWFVDQGAIRWRVGPSGPLFGGPSTYFVFGNGPAFAVAPDGVVWGTGKNDDGPLTKMDAIGAVETLGPLPGGGRPYDLVWGPDNALWFTSISGFGSPTTYLDRISRRTANGTVTHFSAITAGARPSTIIAGPDGNLWFLEPGINSVGRITPQGATAEFPLPAGVTLGGSMTFGPGGDLYFTVSGGVARMTRSGTITQIITGGLTNFAPGSIAYGRDGNLWTTECGLNTVTRISPTGVVTRAPEGSFPTRACPSGMVASADGTPWFYEWNTGRPGRILFASPLATTDDPSDVAATSAALNGLASPRGVATTVHFEYGPTAEYGYRTADQVIGDGDDTVQVTARLAGLNPTATYHYRLVATSVIDTVRGADTTVTTNAVPPLPAPPLPPDTDRDGYPVTVDCDDLSAAIHQGAYDRPGDRIDQDCSGADASYPRFRPNADAGWKKVRGTFVFTRLVIDEMPAGSSLRLACTGPGCTARGYTATLSKPARRLDVATRLKKAKLRKGAVVELVLSRPGYITTVMRWTVGPPPRVSILCQPPGAKKPVAC